MIRLEPDWIGELVSMAASGAVLDFQDRLADAIEELPFGDTATSFAIFVRNFK